ncbi:hypothetical protein [Rhodococcus qingshengii]|uniref:Uncharacterized protein n=1 Tax=Rhodococcus qingshengii TaxID=334542 RepID=A0A2A5J468_RHOSG|nr:hypothetical protein [Rhodococcus qingshengii]PCK24152.1 hypothetical protein CHR55_27310 [Rhodococcus qingshengii]
MSTSPVLTQIPQLSPEAPPGVAELVGKFDGFWWFALIVGIAAFAIGFASYQGRIRMTVSQEFPLLFGGAIAAVVAGAALVWGV